MHAIIESSPQMKAKMKELAEAEKREVSMWALPERTSLTKGKLASKYPLRQMMPGQSFTVPFTDADLGPVFNRCAKASSKASNQFSPAKFCVLVHSELKLIEVGRIK